MRLLTGPAGSGKTTSVLNGLRAALRSGDGGVRLLTPTATLAQHLQNQIAREGFVLHGGVIETLSAFVETYAGDVHQAPDAVLYLLVEEAARKVNRPEFARVVDTPGFCARLAETILEFSSAGCDSARLAACLPDAPLAAPFLEIYREVERQLGARAMALRASLLERAAAHIEREGPGGIRTVWLDGFHALPDPEMRVIGALGRSADVTLTLSDANMTPVLKARLEALGFREERMARTQAEPAVIIVRAQSMPRETEEIARRIVEQASAGRPFREMGIVVRSPAPYVPLLRGALERFGIPARFYAEEALDHHAAIRFLSGAVDAMLGGWEHLQTLGVLRLTPRLADSNAMDKFDFAVREQAPNAGLGPLKAVAEQSASEPLRHKIEALGEIEEWRSFALTPKDWAARFRMLRNLFRPARPLMPERGTAPAGAPAPPADYGQAAALKEFETALDEAALALEGRNEIGLETFWRAVRAVLRLRPLRVPDRRRNVVHVLSAHEARQWVLPVVFVCGMAEKLFPQFHAQDPFFPDSARGQLNVAGVRVRTAAEFEREERALFDSAITRATMSVTFSYAEFDARGQKSLRSLFLEDRLEEEQQAKPSRPRPLLPGNVGGGTREGIRVSHLLQVLREKTESVSPSRLENYLQCPFQYFARALLRLRTRPVRPEDRLDPLAQGTIVHAVLARLLHEPEDFEALFAEEFNRRVDEKQIPPGYHRLRVYRGMLDDLLAYVNDPEAPHGDSQSLTEKEFRFDLVDGLEVNGKIDRLDRLPDGRALVIDYKYSNEKNTKDRQDNDDLLQAPLYLLAAEQSLGLEPAGMTYIGLRGGVLVAPWKNRNLPPDWRQAATERTLGIVARIRDGSMPVAPSDLTKCRWCESRDVCRDAGAAAIAAEEGA